MRIVHEIESKCTVVTGDSGPDSPVTIAFHCLKTGFPQQVREEFFEIEGDREYITKAFEEALLQLKSLDQANKTD